MQKSDLINELAAALSKAQGQIKGAVKDSQNPFFKSNYADLGSCWDSIRKPLSDNGLAVIQTVDSADDAIYIETTLTHLSGQFISGRVKINPVKNDPQGVGSAITYFRRYALAAAVGLYQIDDDANAATGKAPEHKIGQVTKVVSAAKPAVAVKPGGISTPNGGSNDPGSFENFRG